MWDRDELITRCLAATGGSEPLLAVRDVLEEAVSGRALTLGDVGKPTADWLDIWYSSPVLTVLYAVWPPGISLFPHDHRMWAAIGIYGGREDNTFYRRHENTLVASGGRELHDRDVLLLGDDAIHAVRNPLARYTGAVHVYGGDFVATERSMWDPDTLVEAPWDFGSVRQVFDEAENAFQNAEGMQTKPSAT
jgi:predicted metal-dependent enzyme (double-stranded beta helix superfamily)